MVDWEVRVKVLLSLRTLLARHPLVYWLVVAALAAIAGQITVGKMHALDDARRSWSELREVWVATAEVRPGGPVVADARRVPVAFAPASAIGSDPAGATALQRLMPGEVVTTADIGDGPLELLPLGWEGVAFASDETTIEVSRGDHVAVVADGAVVVAEALVVAVAERSVTVAVPSADAPVAALAARSQTAALTLRRPGPQSARSDRHG
jgi:hypothetical protein